ncbi:MAG: glycosyltransferase family 39 protein, partial [Deltaproteobacteria bacterium]|nr:glycosyltransferase family 39 protein [Deltaproteobacteria bacterium]
MSDDVKQPQDAPWDPGYTLPVGGGDREWVRPRGEWWVRLAVIAAAALIFLPNLGAFGLWDPWETHYGEVSRTMVETHDWISPWWGYRSKIGTKKQGEPFYSKPVLIFWTEATAIKAIGFSEWAIRLPMALMAMLAVGMAYYAFSRIVSRRAGLLAAGILATAPQFFYLGRQAQTDMPFVATLTVALLAFMIAVFGPRERPGTRGFLLKIAAGLLLLLGSTVFQYGIIALDLFTEQTPASLWNLVKLNGLYHVVAYGILELALIAWVMVTFLLHLRRNNPVGPDPRGGTATRRHILLFALTGIWGWVFGLHKRASLTFSDEFQDRWIRNVWLLVFYVFCGHSTLGKGLLGFMLPGAILFVWILVTHRWRMLKDLWIPWGLVVFVLVGIPWYLAMFAKHG